MAAQDSEVAHPPTIGGNSTQVNTRISTFKRHIVRNQLWLAALAVILVAGMIVGIVFAIHDHYHSFGGQGWLKARNPKQQEDAARLYLPLQRLEVQPTGVQWSPWYGWLKRSPTNPPFYTCGDQRNICCPVGLICQPTSSTPSKVYCCNATDDSNCQISKRLPMCLGQTVECPAEVGGGCCSPGTACSPSGCVKAETRGPSTAHAPVATTPKEGEVAQNTGTTNSLVLGPRRGCAGALFLLAVFMARL
ncbi:hypothetical protein BP5796_11005 [Coleophoma crateriformis]|uniref:Uncharacterized protein n=1 Tax=Coleophoma crateriformis TaxID=565419 RepID=A0A3D8QLK4_9HELO|nr:hypothetical protein BP5796_11005 [Coleophoma crateriformis]